MVWRPEAGAYRYAGGGGGSGFVWTSETASNVPSGYTVGTEYYLTDAATYGDDATFFASTSGGTEAGHSGNGYARITLVSATVPNYQWIDIQTQKDNGTLKGEFTYNGYVITVTNTDGEESYTKMAIIEGGEKAERNSEYTDGTDTAVIPAGFTVSGVENEQTIDDGLVIYLIPEDETVDWTDGTAVATAQQTYDQFVWIPMPKENINDMYMCQSEDGTKSCNITVQNGNAYCTTHASYLMAGRLYSAGDSATGGFDGGIKTTQTYSSYREPEVTYDFDKALDENTTNLNYLSNVLGTSYRGRYDFKADLQYEYNEIVKSVYENEGFYIGRYETSNMTSTDGTAVKVVSGTISGISNINWYYMYAQQRDYATNKGLNTTLGSTMIQGAAYDQVMIFVDGATDGNGNTFNVKELSSVRHSGSIANTGASLDDKVKNIYDLEGNVMVFSTESLRYRVYRGGCYTKPSSGLTSFYLQQYTAGNRVVLESSTTAATNVGSLCQLYIKAEEESNLIEFKIDGVTYYAEKGMTWNEWVKSDYNTGEWSVWSR